MIIMFCWFLPSLLSTFAIIPDSDELQIIGHGKPLIIHYSPDGVLFTVESVEFCSSPNQPCVLVQVGNSLIL